MIQYDISYVVSYGPVVVLCTRRHSTLNTQQHYYSILNNFQNIFLRSVWYHRSFNVKCSRLKLQYGMSFHIIPGTQERIIIIIHFSYCKTTVPYVLDHRT